MLNLRSLQTSREHEPEGQIRGLLFTFFQATELTERWLATSIDKRYVFQLALIRLDFKQQR